MPLGRGIVELFEAIPDRIEVSGHGPTWRVTGGSFDGALAFAREAFGETAVLAREDRQRWWPRVTLTVTTDPDLAASAPPLDTLSAPPVVAVPVQREPSHRAEPVEAEPRDEHPVLGMLEEIFAHQEAQRCARRGIPQQRTGA
jgi:hypothetical protein